MRNTDGANFSTNLIDLFGLQSPYTVTLWDAKQNREHTVTQAAQASLRSAVYFHHGFFGAPSMYQKIEFNSRKCEQPSASVSTSSLSGACAEYSSIGF